MKKFIAALAVVLTLSTGNLFAEDGQVDDLDAFGLSSMQVVSDVDGMAVRGKASYAFVGGFSQSEFLGGNIGYQEHGAGIDKPFGPSTATGTTYSVSGGAFSLTGPAGGTFSGWGFAGTIGGGFTTAY